MPVSVPNQTEQITQHLHTRLREDTFIDQITSRREDAINDVVDSFHIQTNEEDRPFVVRPDHKTKFKLLSPVGGESLLDIANKPLSETFPRVSDRASRYVLFKADPRSARSDMTAGNLSFDRILGSIQDLLISVNQNLTIQNTPRLGRFVILPDSLVQTPLFRLVNDRYDDHWSFVGTANESFVGKYRDLEVFKASDFLFPKVDGKLIAHYGNRQHHLYDDAVINVQISTDVVGFPGGTQLDGHHIAGSGIVRPDAFGRIEIV